MIESLVVTFSAAAISGLTFLAYKHPDAYESIYKYLNGTLILSTFSVVLWNSAVSYTFIQISTVVRESGYDIYSSAEKTVDSLQVPFTTIAVIYLCISFYLLFLRVLPDILKKE